MDTSLFSFSTPRVKIFSRQGGRAGDNTVRNGVGGESTVFYIEHQAEG